MAALDFDFAHTIRLQFNDLEVARVKAKLIAFEAGKAFFGSGTSSEQDADDGDLVTRM